MRKLLRFIKRIADKIFGTRADEFFWRFRHVIHDRNWAENYISPDALEHSHRKLLLRAVSRHAPLNKVLEVGCASGPNLILLARQFPKTEFLGIDISAKAIEVGGKYIKENSVSNVRLEAGNTDKIKQFADKSFDVVFTDAMLIYVGPEKIKEVLKDMIRIAKKSIILVEWLSKERQTYIADHWSYNWPFLFEELGVPGARVTRFSDESWQGEWAKRGCIVEISLT
jgi:ubiquinone/menaquinone biosynthesis C-methylase UbiE